MLLSQPRILKLCSISFLFVLNACDSGIWRIVLICDIITVKHWQILPGTSAGHTLFRTNIITSQLAFMQLLNLCSFQSYGGPESSTHSNLRKRMQIEKHKQIKKTSSIWQHVQHLENALQIHKTQPNTETHSKYTIRISSICNLRYWSSSPSSVVVGGKMRVKHLLSLKKCDDV